MLLRAKFLVIVLLIFVEFSAAKKQKKPTSLEKATATVSVFLKDVKDFFQDLVDVISDLFTGFGQTKNKNNKISNKNDDWGDGFYKYAKTTLKSGYKMLKNMIPILDMARATIDDVSPILPNVTTTRFIESILNQIVPDLMKTHQQTVVKE